MLQKPSVEKLQELLGSHFYLTDIGVWLLSDKAVKALISHSKKDGEIIEYDLYSEFGCTLGTDPIIDDPELRELSVAILPLPGGEFYHFGTSREMISSTVAIQNIVNDQREIMHNGRKPHPSIFVQNAITRIPITSDNKNIWIENSYVGPHWEITHDNIITGVPENDWHIKLAPGDCIDVVPIGDSSYAIRRYNIDDRFAGAAQQAPVFPVYPSLPPDADAPDMEAERWISAEGISTEANLVRLFGQRRSFQRENWAALAANWRHSVFYQLDLEDAARHFNEMDIPMPPSLPDDAPLLTRIKDAMFRGNSGEAFTLLQKGLTDTVRTEKKHPRMSVYSDQIVWARSPVRIDIAGGWTDTPPFCLMEGGNVINLAI